VDATVENAAEKRVKKESIGGVGVGSGGGGGVGGGSGSD
jgi:hypothetical protein